MGDQEQLRGVCVPVYDSRNTSTRRRSRERDGEISIADEMTILDALGLLNNRNGVLSLWQTESQVYDDGSPLDNADVDPGQRQLARQHQAGRTGARDQDIGIPHGHQPVPSFAMALQPARVPTEEMSTRMLLKGFHKAANRSFAILELRWFGPISMSGGVNVCLVSVRPLSPALPPRSGVEKAAVTRPPDVGSYPPNIVKGDIEQDDGLV